MWTTEGMRRARALLMAVLGLTLGLCGRLATAQDASQPLMLVAAPQLGGFYQHTVLIAVPVAGDRHVGFIINRPTTKSLAALFPQHEASQKVAAPVFLGGPEMVTSIFAVLRRADKTEGSDFPFVQGTFVIADQKSIDHVIETSPNEARYYAGFVAWQPGELQDELDKGYWLVMPPQSELIFQQQVEKLWDDLLVNASRTMTQGPLNIPRLALAASH